MQSFDLKNYASTADLDLAGWAHNFALRGYFWRCIKILSGELVVSSAEKALAQEENWQDFLGNVFVPKSSEVKLPNAKSLIEVDAFEEFVARDESENVLGLAGERFLRVNLDAPDKLLQAQFTRWLAEQRALNKKKKVFSAADLQRWHNLRLLPCLDLTIYGEMTGKPIKQHELADLTFSDETEIDPVQKIRQTCLPLARQLIEESTLAAMWAQL